MRIVCGIVFVILKLGRLYFICQTDFELDEEGRTVGGWYLLKALSAAGEPRALNSTVNGELVASLVV